jgi:hypothetical protein
MMFKIKAPNEAYTGEIAGVAFLNGLAETDNERMIDWFREKGYSVEEVKANVRPRKTKKSD